MGLSYLLSTLSSPLVKKNSSKCVNPMISTGKSTDWLCSPTDIFRSREHILVHIYNSKLCSFRRKSYMPIVRIPSSYNGFTTSFSLCQVIVGTFSFFFMINIFSYKFAILYGNFRLSPLVCFLAVGKFLSRAKPHVVQSTLDRNFPTAFL